VLIFIDPGHAVSVLPDAAFFIIQGHDIVLAATSGIYKTGDCGYRPYGGIQ